MEFYCPSLKKKVKAEITGGRAISSKGGSHRYVLEGIYDGRKCLPKTVKKDVFEQHGFNAENVLAVLKADTPEPLAPASEPEPEAPATEPTNSEFNAPASEPEPAAPSSEPEPAEPTNEHFESENAKAFSAYSDEISDRQMWMIKKLGGSPSKSLSRSQASDYIKRLQGRSPTSWDAENMEWPKQAIKDLGLTQEQMDEYDETRIGPVCLVNKKWTWCNKDRGIHGHIPSKVNREDCEYCGIEGMNNLDLRAESGNTVGCGWCDGVVITGDDYEYVFCEGCDKYAHINCAPKTWDDAYCGECPASKEFNAEALVEYPDWLPEGDGRALGQQNFGINLSPLHAEAFDACGVCEMEAEVNEHGWCSLCAEQSGSYDSYRADGIDPEASYVVEPPLGHGVTQYYADSDNCPVCEINCGYEDLCGDCDNCHDCCTCVYCEPCDLRIREESIENGACPSCHGEIIALAADSDGLSRNAQIAIGLTALGVGVAMWKADAIMNLWDSLKKLGE